MEKVYDQGPGLVPLRGDYRGGHGRFSQMRPSAGQVAQGSLAFQFLSAFASPPAVPPQGDENLGVVDG